MERPFVAINTRERERLLNLVNNMTDAELKIPLYAGWTVAVALAHLAYWDQRAFVLMQKWQKEGVKTSTMDVDVANDTLVPFFLALDPRVAANLAVTCAETIDHALEKAPEELIKEMESLHDSHRFYRSIHRKMHLDEIEKVLLKPRSSPA